MVGFVAALYSLVDVGSAERRYGFYPFLMLMMAGVGGAFLTGDVFNLYVWFEVPLADHHSSSRDGPQIVDQ